MSGTGLAFSVSRVSRHDVLEVRLRGWLARTYWWRCYCGAEQGGYPSALAAAIAHVLHMSDAAAR